MKKATKIRIVLSLIGIIVGAFLISDTLRILATGYDNSKLFSALFGGGLLSFVFIENLLALKFQLYAKILRMIFIIFMISFVIVEGLIIFTSSKKPNSADVVIVLGAGVRPSGPSPLLRMRLDEAYDFLIENPETICIVTGGQGPNEHDSEAAVMAKYLEEKGLDSDRIIIENKATNTIENFTFSKALLDEYFSDRDYKTVYVTNGFHVYRSGLIAKKSGLKADGLAADTLPGLQLNYHIREYCSLIVYWLLR